MSRRAYLFLAVFLFNGVQKGAVEYIARGLDMPFRLLVAAGDVVVILMAATALLRVRSFYAARVLVFFLAGSFLTLAYNFEATGFALHFSGLREPLFFLSALIVSYDLLSGEEGRKFERAFSGVFLGFVILQAPMTVFQFLRYGANDFVGGTFGWGGSGIISLLVFLAAFYSIARSAEREGDDAFSVKRIAQSSLLLLPIAVNETKVSFLLLGVYLLLLADFRKLGQLIAVSVVAVALFVVLVAFYGENVQDTGRLLDWNFLERYLFYDRRESVDVPRFQKLVMSLAVMADDPVTVPIGMGYGAFMGGNILEASALRQTYGFLSGSRMFLNTVVWQGGLVAMLAFLFGTFGFLGYRRGWVVPLRRLGTFLLVMVAGIWIYSDAFLNRTFGTALGFVMAWLAVRAEQRDDEAPESAAQTGDDGEED